MKLPEELGRDARLLSGEGLWEAPKGGGRLLGRLKTWATERKER